MKKNILLTFVLLAGVVAGLSGCKEKTEYDPNNFIETGDKIVKEKIELTFFAPLHSLHTKEGFNAMKLFKVMEEKTNIHINWVYGNVSNYDETVNNIINAEQPETTEEVATGGFMDAPQPKDLDPYFKTAVKLVMANNGASVSYLQRRLQIGYSRAARIIDQMEDKNYIAPSTGAKLRKVLITPEQFREEFGEDCDSLND